MSPSYQPCQPLFDPVEIFSSHIVTHLSLPQQRLGPKLRDCARIETLPRSLGIVIAHQARLDNAVIAADQSRMR